MLKEITLTVNDEDCPVAVQPHWSLAHVLREKVGLTGTKMGCEMGTCGSCTVIMDGKPIFSCLKMGIDAEGSAIRTIESLEKGGEVDALQAAFMEHHGMQCGFCTSGMIVAGRALLDENPDPTDLEVRQAIAGHLCRCGTYTRIVKSILAAAGN